MSKSEQALILAKKILAHETQIAEISAELMKLKGQFNQLIDGNSLPGASCTSENFEHLSDAGKIRHFLTINQGKTVALKDIYRALPNVDRKAIRSNAYRFAKEGAAKNIGRGKYRWVGSTNEQSL